MERTSYGAKHCRVQGHGARLRPVWSTPSARTRILPVLRCAGRAPGGERDSLGIEPSSHPARNRGICGTEPGGPPRSLSVRDTPVPCRREAPVGGVASAPLSSLGCCRCRRDCGGGSGSSGSSSPLNLYTSGTSHRDNHGRWVRVEHSALDFLPSVWSQLSARSVHCQRRDNFQPILVRNVHVGRSFRHRVGEHGHERILDRRFQRPGPRQWVVVLVVQRHGIVAELRLHRAALGLHHSELSARPSLRDNPRFYGFSETSGEALKVGNAGAITASWAEINPPRTQHRGLSGRPLAFGFAKQSLRRTFRVMRTC